MFPFSNNCDSILGTNLITMRSKEAALPTARQQFGIMNRVPLRERSSIDSRGNLPQNNSENVVENLFFCKKNVGELLAITQTKVNEMSGCMLSIPVQSPKNMLSVMNFIYETQRGMSSESELCVIQQKEQLNKRVLEFVVPHIYNEALSYALFLQNQNQPLEPMPRANQVDRDFKELRF